MRVSSSGRRRSMMSNSFGLVSNCSNSARVSSCESGLGGAAGLAAGSAANADIALLAAARINNLLNIIVVSSKIRCGSLGAELVVAGLAVVAHGRDRRLELVAGAAAVLRHFGQRLRVRGEIRDDLVEVLAIAPDGGQRARLAFLRD